MNTLEETSSTMKEKVTQPPVETAPPAARPRRKKKIWIDLDNSPHVPLFMPIIEELKKQDFELMLTARNMYQVRELLDFYGLSCRVIGGHYGKNKLLKVLGTFVRVAQLMPVAAKGRPDLAISHGSRAQTLVSKALGIPVIMMHDYEFSTKTGFLEPDWVLVPEVIPAGTMTRKNQRTLRYPGIKEDVYVPRFRPDASVLTQLGIAKGELVVTVRPPATEAHYHNPESEILLAETLKLIGAMPKARAVVLPRNARQGEQLRAQWSPLIASGHMIVPNSPVDGLNLVWFSDLVVSGGGTMNREAAALGVPVYSIFRGKIGAVDHYLEAQGRLTLIESVEDVHTKIKFAAWDRPAQPESKDRPALRSVLDSIHFVLRSRDPRHAIRPNEFYCKPVDTVLSTRERAS
jgi:uncharacterized protein